MIMRLIDTIRYWYELLRGPQDRIIQQQVRDAQMAWYDKQDREDCDCD